MGIPDPSRTLSFPRPALRLIIPPALSRAKNPLTLSYKGRKFPALQLVLG